MSDLPESPPRRRPPALLILFVLAAVAVPTAYTLYTNHIWEDYFITFRHSQNLCEGKGLLFNPPERVHGFTSPLGVLLPALFHRITGMGSYSPPLWLFRAASLIAFAGSAVFLLHAVSVGVGDETR